MEHKVTPINCRNILYSPLWLARFLVHLRLRSLQFHFLQYRPYFWLVLSLIKVTQNMCSERYKLTTPPTITNWSYDLIRSLRNDSKMQCQLGEYNGEYFKEAIGKCQLCCATQKKMTLCNLFKNMLNTAIIKILDSFLVQNFFILIN